MRIEWNRIHYRIIDVTLDFLYNVKTRGIIETNVSDDSFHASTVAYSAIGKMLTSLELQPNDVFVDIGCGTGRVLAMAAQFPLSGIIGIEASPSVTEIVRKNMANLKWRKCDVFISNMYAEQFNYAHCTAAYCFNSFGAKTLATVLDKIANDRETQPFRLCFLNPTPEYIEKFLERDWTIYDEGRAQGMSYILARLN